MAPARSCEQLHLRSFCSANAPTKNHGLFPCWIIPLLPILTSTPPTLPVSPKMGQTACREEERQVRASLTACLSVFSSDWPCCWSWTRADCNTEGPHLHRTCVWKSKYLSSEMAFILELRYNSAPAPALAPALNSMYKNLSSVIHTCSIFRNSLSDILSLISPMQHVLGGWCHCYVNAELVHLNWVPVCAQSPWHRALALLLRRWNLQKWLKQQICSSTSGVGAGRGFGKVQTLWKGW